MDAAGAVKGFFPEEGDTCVDMMNVLLLMLDCGDGDGMGTRIGAGVKYSGIGIDEDRLALGVDG